MSAIRHKKRGFTIVELVVVIAVIGILSTIIVVSFRTSIDRAQKTLIKNNMAAVSKSIQIYRTQNGTYPRSVATLLEGADAPVKKSLFSTESDPYRWIIYCTNDVDFVVAGRQELKTGSWWAAVGSDMDLTDDAPAGVSGSGGTTCAALGLPGAYWIWIKASAGWHVSIQE